MSSFHPMQKPEQSVISSCVTRVFINVYSSPKRYSKYFKVLHDLEVPGNSSPVISAIS